MHALSSIFKNSKVILKNAMIAWLNGWMASFKFEERGLRSRLHWLEAILHHFTRFTACYFGSSGCEGDWLESKELRPPSGPGQKPLYITSKCPDSCWLLTFLRWGNRVLGCWIYLFIESLEMGWHSSSSSGRFRRIAEWYNKTTAKLLCSPRCEFKRVSFFFNSHKLTTIS